MTVRDVLQWLEAWAPRGIAWERDNIGLQVGDPSATVTGILVALDLTAEVVREARRLRANLILSHHPLIFKPIKALSGSDENGRVVRSLVQHNLNLIAAHTNLDFTRGGTSFALAEALGMRKTDFLLKSYKNQTKIVTYVPADAAEKVADAMAAAGAGRIGNYDHCSFRMEGIGTFRGNDKSHPAIGRRGALERVPEIRLEMLADEWHTEAIVSAMKHAHPYEEVAFEVYRVENASGDFGMGVIGELSRSVQLKAFLKTVKRALAVPSLRVAGEPERVVRRVAVCGGSGSELLDEAIRRSADAFITADVRYHTFHSAEGRIALIDAGHYETEHPVVGTLVKRMKYELRGRTNGIRIAATRVRTNPVQYA